MRGPDARRMVQWAGDEVDRFCEEWIGWSLPPVAQAIEEAQWQPTPLGGYCGRCGQTVGAGEVIQASCGTCRGTAIPTDRLVRLGSFSEDLRQWILQVKYSRWSEMGRHLGSELGRAVLRADVIDPPRTLVVPMPMPWLRRVQRGIDHAEVIASAAAEEIGVPVARVLAKANGPTQLTVPKSARRVNARHGMRIRRRWGGWPLTALHVVVVDDVRTTGSSMAAAARLLRSLGAKRVIGAVVAVAESGRRGLKPGAAKAEEEPA